MSLFDLIEPHAVEDVWERVTLTPRERFERFHARNPHVYELLEGMAAQVWRSGRRRIGIATLVESLRWQYWLTTEDCSRDFKIDNSLRAPYARLIMERNPDWKGLFALRESGFDDYPVAPGITLAQKEQND